MQTKRFDGIEPLRNDEKIAAAILRKADPYGPSGKAMYIAILGPTGECYRAIRAFGLGEYMDAIHVLKGFGLFDTEQALTAHGIRFDDVFSARKPAPHG